MKGKKMTTENTTPVTDIAPPTAEQIAEDFVKNNTTSVIIAELVKYTNSIESLKARVAAEAGTSDHWRQKFVRQQDKIEEWLKSYISENNDASVDDMKEFAETLGIELTKNIKVSFGVEVTVEMTVPLDFDMDSIDEGSFTVSAEFDGMTDVEVEDTEIVINEFEVEED